MRKDADHTASRPASVTLRATESLGAALRDGARWAAIRKPHRVTSLHLLLGLIHAEGSIAQAVLLDNEVSDANVWSAIDYWDPPRAGAHRAPKLLALRPKPRWKSSALRAADAATANAVERGSTAVDTGDLLLALHTDHGSRATRILERAQLDFETVQQLVKLARGEIDEGRGVEELPDFSATRPVRPEHSELHR